MEKLEEKYGETVMALKAAGYRILPPLITQSLAEAEMDAKGAERVLVVAEMLEKLRQRYPHGYKLAPAHLFRRIMEEMAKLGEDLAHRAPKETIQVRAAEVTAMALNLTLSLDNGTPVHAVQVNTGGQDR